MAGPIAHQLQLQTAQPTVRQNEIGLEDALHQKRLMIIEDNDALRSYLYDVFKDDYQVVAMATRHWTL